MPDLRLLLGAGLICAAGALGWWLGTGHVQGRWDAAELQRERAVAALGAQERRRQASESDRHEAERREIRARLPTLTQELRHDLQAPIVCPPAGQPPLELGAVPVPGVVVERLRRAGTDPGAS